MEQRNDTVRQLRQPVSDPVEALALARLLRLEADRLERIRAALITERQKLEAAIEQLKQGELYT